MSLNVDPSHRQRRKSTLGRRNRNNDQPLPRSLYPVIQINSLPWSRSGKKKQSNLGKASKDFMSKKRLFLISPSEDFMVNSIQGEKRGTFQRGTIGSSEIKPTSLILQNDSQSSGDSSLNVTGIQNIKTPSPPDTSLSLNISSIKFHEDYKYTTQDKSAIKPSKQYEFPVPNSLRHNHPVQRTSRVSHYFGFDELEPPKSPGPSLYNKLVLEEFADLKPPVDPDDNVPMSSNYVEANNVQEQTSTNFSLDSMKPKDNVSILSNYPGTNIAPEPTYPKFSLNPMSSDGNVDSSQSQSLINPSINSEVDTVPALADMKYQSLINSRINSEIDSVPALADMKYPVNLGSSKDQLQQNMLAKESRTCQNTIFLNNSVNSKIVIESLDWPREGGLVKTNEEKQHCSPKTTESNNTAQFKEPVLKLSLISKDELEENSNLNCSNELSAVGEDLDTTDMFLLTEQTILEQDQTLTGQINTTENCTSMTNTFLEPVLEVADRSETDEELDQTLKEIDEWLEDMHQNMKKMNNLKKKVQRIINKRQCIKNEKEENKENVPASKTKKLQNEWIDSLKSGNPSLLKTPNLAKFKKPRTSLLDHSTTWTPRSLSSVLHEQVEDLFE